MFRVLPLWHERLVSLLHMARLLQIHISTVIAVKGWGKGGMTGGPRLGATELVTFTTNGFIKRTYRHDYFVSMSIVILYLFLYIVLKKKR